MKEILKFLKPYWKAMLMATIVIGFSTLCDLLLPTLMSDILNNGVYQRDLHYILNCCLQMLAIAALGFAAVLAGAKLSSEVIAGFCADLRGHIFRKVNDMSFEEFGKLGTAALVTRATHDVETVSWVASELSGTLITIPVLFFGGVILSVRKDLWLSLTLLAFVPVILLIVLLVGKKIVPLWNLSDEYIDKQNEIMRQRLRGIRVIRAFNAEDKEHDKIAHATRVMAGYIIKSNVSMGIITPVATFLLNFATVLIVYLGAVRMENSGSISGGDIFAIVQYISLVSASLIMGAFSIIMLPHAKVSAKRINQVLHAKGLADPVQRQDIQLSGDIVFDNVSFTYEGAAEHALKDISFHIQKGQKISIIGGTGSGKSTVVSMLLGFRIPTSGEVRFDGVPVRQLSRHTIRQNMSCVLQNSSIYSGTIRENIRMGKPDAADEEILDALKIAQAEEFVSGFTDGLDYEIKQSGKNLSGGQKQRLSIARAILKNAPVYIFDDSFSALDFLTEANLRNALNRRIDGKTQIVITQRVTSAMNSDCIYVMDKGRIVGAGTHEKLLSSCNVYAEIYASQTGGAK